MGFAVCCLDTTTATARVLSRLMLHTGRARGPPVQIYGLAGPVVEMGWA
jgi:hypothetical protein